MGRSSGIEIWYDTHIKASREHNQQVSQDLRDGGVLVSYVFAMRMGNFVLKTRVEGIAMKYGEDTNGEGKYDYYSPSGSREARRRSASRAMRRLGEREMAMQLRGVSEAQRQVNFREEKFMELPLAS